MTSSRACVAALGLCLASTFPAGRAAAQVCGGTPCVSSADIVNGQVKSADLGAGAVTTAKLENGAVTGVKVLDNSLTERDISVAQRVVVAQGGGDFTTIGAALAAISPGAATPYVVEVMPGTYAEAVEMKSFVHLRGAGRELVTISSRAAPAGIHVPAGASTVRISGLAVETGGGAPAILVDGDASDVTIHDTTLRDSQWGILTSSGATVRGNRIANNAVSGIRSLSPTPLLVTGNAIEANGARGIDDANNAASLIAGNSIHGNGGPGIYLNGSDAHVLANSIVGNGDYGVEATGDSRATISGNTVTGNGVGGLRSSASSAPIVVHNRVDGNGRGPDILVGATTIPHISYNVYELIKGVTGVGQFNLRPDGSPAPAP